MNDLILTVFLWSLVIIFILGFSMLLVLCGYFLFRFLKRSMRQSDDEFWEGI